MAEVPEGTPAPDKTDAPAGETGGEQQKREDGEPISPNIPGSRQRR